MNEKRHPMNGTFELTGRCNLSCKMCLVRVDQKRIDELGLRERTTEEWIDMARQVRDAGTFALLLTGGEVMLRPDFCEIYEAIAQMGFLLTVYTNATMVTDKVMETFKKFPPHKIGVTMYGASNDTYETMCGCKDGYDRFVAGIRKLSSLPSRFEIRTTIIKDNWHDLPAMREFTKKEFGDEKILTVSRFVTDAVRGGIACPKECRLTPEENVELTQESLTTFHRQVMNGERPLPKETEEKFAMQQISLPKEGSYLFENCKAGEREYSIAWSGHMYACELLNRGYTKPFEAGFLTAWEELPKQYPKGKIVEQCQNCKYAALCESCPAVRLAETGEWFGIPEYACKEAKKLHQILSDLHVI